MCKIVTFFQEKILYLKQNYWLHLQIVNWHKSLIPNLWVDIIIVPIEKMWNLWQTVGK